MTKSKKEKKKMPAAKSNKPGGPVATRKGPKVPANSQGETIDLSELGLTDKFHQGRSQYDAELEKLVADTKASEHPERVGRKYADPRAQNSLKKRAELKGIPLEFLNLPNGQGFVVRIDPNPQPKVSQKKPPAPAAAAAPEPQSGTEAA